MTLNEMLEVIRRRRFSCTRDGVVYEALTLPSEVWEVIEAMIIQAQEKTYD